MEYDIVQLKYRSNVLEIRMYISFREPRTRAVPRSSLSCAATATKSFASIGCQTDNVPITGNASCSVSGPSSRTAGYNIPGNSHSQPPSPAKTQTKT